MINISRDGEYHVHVYLEKFQGTYDVWWEVADR